MFKHFLTGSFASVRLASLVSPSLLILSFLAFCAPPVHGGVPSTTDFTSNEWKRHWSVHLAPESRVETRDGGLEISGREKTHANLRRPLGQDNLRITCEIKSADMGHWTPSIFLYWDNSNWMQTGFRTGPIFASSPFCAMMDNGNLDEAWGFLNQDRGHFWCYDPARGMLQPRPLRDLTAPVRWRHLGVDITSRWVYFLTSEDGKTWTRYRRLLRKSETMRAAPAQLIIGKGFSNPAAGLSQEFLCNDAPQTPGGETECAIQNIIITTLPDDLQKEQFPERFQPNDASGDAVLSQTTGPSFEAVKDLFPPLKFSREVIGVKDHPDDFAITPEAAIHFVKGYYAFEIGDPAVRFGRGGDEPRISKRLLHGYMPVIFSSWAHKAIAYEECAFAISEGFSPDSPIRACVRLTLSNTTEQTKEIRVALRQFRDDGTIADDNAPAASWSITLRPRDSKAIHLSLPHDFAKTIESISAQVFDHDLANVEAYWKELLNRGMTIDVPEERVVNAYRAWLGYNYLNVQKIDGRYEPHDGSGFYSMIYGISATLYCRILDEYGRHDDATRYLDSLLNVVKPDGSFIVNYGLPDIGALLVALNDHYQLTRDRDWLARVAPQVLKMSTWITDRRRTDRAKQSPDSVCYGMIFEQPYCDYPNKAYNFVSDLHLAAGLYSAADSLDAAGMKGDADRVRDEADAYRTDILTAMKRSAIDIGGAKAIPIFPETHALFKASSYTAQDYYSLMAGQMLEKGLLDPDGWEARSIIRMMEQHGGLTLGMCRFWGGIDHAYTYGYWYNCLQRGDAKRVLLGFYGSLAYGMSRDTFSAVEITHISTGNNQGTLPHLYSNTQQLRLLRAMLLHEEAHSLHLCRAIPTAWLENGKAIGVNHAPTRFGEISFKIKSDLANNQILATIDAPTAGVPELTLRLRHPAGTPIRRATVDGKAVTFTNDTATLTNARGTVTIRAEFD